MKPFDVLLSTLYFYPTYSGPSVRFHRYSAGLRERGVNLRVFSAAQSAQAPDTPIGARLAPHLVDDVIPVERVRIDDKLTLQTEGVYYRALLDYARQNRPQLVQMLTLGLNTLPHFLAFRRLGIPLVYTHTMLGDLSESALRRNLQKLYWRLPYQMVDCVVTSSEIMKAGLQEIGVSTRTVVIQNGVDTTRFKPLPNPEARLKLRETLKLPVQQELVLFIGSLSKRKAVDVLLEAWQNVLKQRPQAVLVLVGPSYGDIRAGQGGSFEAKLQTLIQQLPSEAVILTGPVNNVQDYLNAADVFMFPSEREGMPNVIPEAYASGTPVIMTPFIGLPSEFGQAGVHYELVERQAESMARAMLDLLQNPHKRQIYADNALKWARETMSVAVSLDQYTALYADLITRRR